MRGQNPHKILNMSIKRGGVIKKDRRQETEFLLLITEPCDKILGLAEPRARSSSQESELSARRGRGGLSLGNTRLGKGLQTSLNWDGLQGLSTPTLPSCQGEVPQPLRCVLQTQPSCEPGSGCPHNLAVLRTQPVFLQHSLSLVVLL